MIHTGIYTETCQERLCPERLVFVPSAECHDRGKQLVVDTVRILINKTMSVRVRDESLRLVYEESCLNKLALEDKDRSSVKRPVLTQELRTEVHEVHEVQN